MAISNTGHVMVVGHKNPDTDSICSAIAYARLKEKETGERYEPKRAGQLNPETEFVLDYLKLPVPELITDVGTQVKDMEIRETAGVDSGISLKKAWSLMKDLNVFYLVTERPEAFQELSEEAMEEYGLLLVLLSGESGQAPGNLTLDIREWEKQLDIISAVSYNTLTI